MKSRYFSFSFLAIIAIFVSRSFPIVKTAEIPMPEEPSGLYATGSYLYVACVDSGLRIYNVSDSSSPSLAGTYDSSGRQEGLYDVVVSGNYAYAARGVAGIVVFDISVPANPTKIDQVAEGGGECIAFSGGYAYTANSRGMDVYNVGTVGASVKSATWYANADSSTFESAVDIAVMGSYAFVAFEDSGLYVIDISNPTAPSLTGRYLEDDGMRISAVAVNGDVACLSTSDEGLKIIDISTPSSPKLSGSYHRSGGGDGWDVAVVGTNVYLLYQEWGVYLIDISTLTSPSYVGKYPSGTSFGDDFRYLTVAGKTAYVYNQKNGSVYILNAGNDISVRNPGIPDYATVGHIRAFWEKDGAMTVFHIITPNGKHLKCDILLFSANGRCLASKNRMSLENGQAFWKPDIALSSGFYIVRLQTDMVVVNRSLTLY